MPAAFILAGVDPKVGALHQEGLLERGFHDALAPNLRFRSLAGERETAEANTGTSIFMTRRGLLPVITDPVNAQDGEAVPQTLGYEQWVATLGRYWGAIDTSISQSAHSIADQLMSNIHALGVQAGMSINRIARNAIYSAYVSGHTALTSAALSADTSVRVASLNGFRFVLVKGTNVAPQAVSSALPLLITINSTISAAVIQAIPDDAADPDGPGTLVLSAAIGAGVAARAPVLSGVRPQIVRSGGGLSVDAIGSSDIFTLSDAEEMVTRLRDNYIEPHEDGYYHCEIPNRGVAQVFQDDSWKQLNTALPDSERYAKLYLGQIVGIRFYANTECPDFRNSGPTKSTSSGSALYSKEIHAETVNHAGVQIGRAIVTGKGAMYERWFDQKKNYVSEVGITGQQGDFNVVNNNITIETDGIRLVIRSPIDRAMDVVSALWDITTCFPIPSDIGGGSGPELYKRAVVGEFAIG